MAAVAAAVAVVVDLVAVAAAAVVVVDSAVVAIAADSNKKQAF